MTSAVPGRSIVSEMSRRASRIGIAVRSLYGWRRYGLAFGSGLASALSFAPFNVFPCLLFALALLVLLIDGSQADGRRVRLAAMIGWAFGFGYFLAGLYWVGYAFTVDPTQHAWQIPFVELLLPGGLALFPACACAAAAWFWRKAPARIFIFAASVGVSEWLRGHILTGFPWNLAAYAWGTSLPVLQSASVIGAYGLTLLTVLFGASLAGLFGNAPDRRLAACMTGLFVVLWTAGVLRLEMAKPANVPGVELRLVQPNVRQQDKYVPEYRARNWQELVDLTMKPATVAPTHVIWPEAAPPFLLTRVPQALDAIAALTEKHKVLMTGSVRVLASPDGGYNYFNSFYIFADGGRLLDAYNKFHLVPFGEYLPLSGLLTKLSISKLVDSPGGFTPGDGPHTYLVPGAPAVGPLICYEILFPGAVTAKTRPGWLVNVTDDSWFGPSTGPYQHLLTAQVRAIEEGLPVARAANTGISAVIDPYGHVLVSLGLGKTGIVDSPLPVALPNTLYARLGDSIFAVMVVACVLAAVSRRSYNHGQRRDDTT